MKSLDSTSLPILIRTRTEAENLADQLFPGATEAINRMPPETELPRHQLDWEVADRLRAVFYWLYDQEPKVYERAKWHLFYDLALNVVRELDENGQAKVHALCARDAALDYRRRQAAQTMTGAGQGI